MHVDLPERGSLCDPANLFIAKTMAESGVTKALEIGCGGLDLTRKIISSCPGIALTAIDKDRNVIAESQEKLPQARFNYHTLPARYEAPDESFEAVVGGEIFEHLNDEAVVQSLVEAKRLVPANSGIVMISVLDPSAHDQVFEAMRVERSSHKEGVVTEEVLLSRLTRFFRCSEAQARKSFPIGSLHSRRPRTYRRLFAQAGLPKPKIVTKTDYTAPNQSAESQGVTAHVLISELS